MGWICGRNNDDDEYSILFHVSNAERVRYVVLDATALWLLSGSVFSQLFSSPFSSPIFLSILLLVIIVLVSVVHLLFSLFVDIKYIQLEYSAQKWPVASRFAGRARYPRGSMSTKPSAPLAQQRGPASAIASKSAWSNGPPRSTSTLTVPSSLPTSAAVSSSPTGSFHTSSLQALPPAPVTHSPQPQPAKSTQDQSSRRTLSIASPPLPTATLSRHSCKSTFQVYRSAPHIRYSCGPTLMLIHLYSLGPSLSSFQIKRTDKHIR